MNMLAKFSARFFLIILCLFFISGCKTFKNYNNSVSTYYKNLKNGNTNSLKNDLKKLEKTKDSDSDFLLAMEEYGKLNFIIGDFDESFKGFSKAVEYYNILEDKAKIELSKLSQNAVSATVLNDRSIRYDGYRYEESMVHLYLSLIYLSRNDIDSAMVEVRKNTDLQKFIEDDNQNKIAKALEETEKNKYVENTSEAKNIFAENRDILSQSKEKFLNSYVYYISGIIREIYKDNNASYIDYKKAFESSKENPSLIKDLLRLSKIYDPSYYRELLRSYSLYNNNNEIDNYYSKKTILIIYEKDFIPRKQEFKLNLFVVDGNWISFSLPYLETPKEILNNSLDIKITMENGDNALTKIDLLTDVSEIAKFNFAADFPLIVARSISRATVKATVNQAKRRNNDSHGNNANIGLAVGSVLMNLAEHADLRIWTSLPRAVYIKKINFDQDMQEIMLGNVIVKIPKIKEGNILILYLVDYNNYIYSYNLYNGIK